MECDGILILNSMFGSFWFSKEGGETWPWRSLEKSTQLGRFEIGSLPLPLILAKLNCIGQDSQAGKNMDGVENRDIYES